MARTVAFLVLLACSKSLFSSAARFSGHAERGGCGNLKATFLCSEQRPSHVFEKIGGMGQSDLDCIVNLCKKEGSEHKCCGVLSALKKSPIITETQTTPEFIAKQQKMQAVLDAADSNEASSSPPVDPPIPKDTPRAASGESAPVAELPTVDDSQPRPSRRTNLSPGCKPLLAITLCKEHRPANVFQSIGTLEESDLDCIGTLCEVKGADHSCCSVLRALQASPIITEKQQQPEDVLKQSKMQTFLDKYPPPPAP